MNKTISFYNEQVEGLKVLREKKPTLSADEYKTTDLTKISWCSSLVPKLNNLVKAEFDEDSIETASYRPFVKENLYFGDLFIHRRGQFDKLFPKRMKNYVICITGVGFRKTFTSIITDSITDLEFVEKAQCFPLYWYEIIEPDQNSLFGDDDAQIVKHEAISDFILGRAQSKYGNKVQREDIFYYVYGILHSKSYRENFDADLKMKLPRIPLVSDYEKFWAFSKAGRNLANLHLNYEKVAPCPDVTVEGDDKNDFIVKKMSFPKKGEKQTIIYNDKITISNIPEKAYEYVVNGKSAIEWIMERYAVTTDQKSGITNNPNDWATEHDKPRYILDLLLSVINVSVQTVDIVNSLPEVDWDKE